VFYIPGIPQAELSCCSPNLSSLATLSFESRGEKKGVVVFLLHIHLITVAMIFLPSARQEKKPPPSPPQKTQINNQPPKKPQTTKLTVQMCFFMT